LKRSNRLVLLVGVFLAIVAFVGILLLVRNPSGQGATPTVPTTGPVVVATIDIPLSTRVRADQVTTQVVPLTAIPADAFVDASQVIGQIVRQPVAKGAQLTAATFGGTSSGTVTQITTPVGLRSMAVQVDQVSGVGTVIKPGDYVDMVIGLTADKFPVSPPVPPDLMNHTSVKLLIQGLQVLGTLLPPQETSAAPAPTASGEPVPGTPSQPNTSLNGQQQIVILAVTPQQVETRPPVHRCRRSSPRPLASSSGPSSTPTASCRRKSSGTQARNHPARTLRRLGASTPWRRAHGTERS
jgi:pilus assembly protein CpaB